MALDVEQLGQAGADAAVSLRANRAAEDQAVEVAEASAALRRTVGRLAESPDLERFLPGVLSEAAAQTNAVTAALFEYLPATQTLRLHTVVAEGVQVRPDLDERFASILEPIPASKKAGWAELVAGKSVLHDLEDPAALPSRKAAAFHRLMHHRFVLSVPVNLGSRPLGFIGVCFRQELRPGASKVELLEALAAQTALALELTRLSESAKRAAVVEERNRFARDIHDTLAQGFTGVIVQLEAAQDAMAEEDQPSAAAHVAQAAELARSSLLEARRSVHALRNKSLEDGTLVSALEKLVAKVTAHTSLRVDLRIEGTPQKLPPIWEDELLRISQEALTNVLKHARAANLSLRVNFGPVVTICIQDDGSGAISNAKEAGFGLVGMRERAERIGAHLIIESLSGRGTTISVSTSPLTSHGNLNEASERHFD